MLKNSKISIKHLGWKDSNLWMSDPNSDALPLGDTPTCHPKEKNYLLLDLNEWQSAYEADALTNWAKQAIFFLVFYIQRAEVGFEPTTFRLWAWRGHHSSSPLKMSQSNCRFPYSYLVTTSLQSFKWSWTCYRITAKNDTFSESERVQWGAPVGKVFWPLELPECDGRGVQGPGTNSPWRADPRLLVIPTSCSRVAESNLNYDRFLGFTPTRIIVAHCTYHCNTCVAQPIRVMKTWRHPHLPLGCP